MIAVRVARKLQLVGVALSLIVLSACQLETKPDSGLPGEIVSFDLYKADNPGLPQDVSAGFVGDNLTLFVPAESDVTSLVPTIEFQGESVSPASGEAQDFTDPVEYVVTTPEGRERTYTVTVSKAASSSKDISHFLIDSVEGTISGTDITLTVPHGSSLTELRPSIIHSGLSISPTSGSSQDFTEPVEYTVTARNGTTKTYMVFVSVAPSDAKDIVSFAIANSTAEINGTQITLSLPSGTDVRALQPSITHTGVRLSPDSATPQDFRGPVQYTVTAADGTTQDYTVLVSVTPNDAKSITRFSAGGRTAAISGTAITLTLPFGTDLEHLSATVQHTGKSVSPASGVEQDFREPVTYTVTAADGSTTEYTVTVSVAPNTAKEITGFEILGNSADINGTTITLTLPFGTATTALVPTINYTAASIQPASGVARNFNTPVNYLVTAADGSTRTYSVIITVAASDSKAITQFRLAGVQGDIASAAISLTVPFGTNVSAIAPVITHNGTSVQPPSGQARDFTAPQTYTVTAQDGTTHDYTVTVTVARSSAKAITAFVLTGRSAIITGTAITLTVPFGTVVGALSPAITHTGASISPGNGASQNFGQPVQYTVTAADESVTVYTVTVTVARNDAKAITGFTIPGQSGSIGESTITLNVPFGTNVNALTPTIVHTGVSVSPASGVPQNFSSSVMYTVTAQDETTRQYVVTVNVAAPSSTKEITGFSILGASGNINGTAISVTLPQGTSPTALVPTITHTGQSVSPASGMAQDFTSPVMFQVTAQDSSVRIYTVTVMIPQSDAKDILSFDIAGGMTAPIGANTINVTVPNGTVVTALTPTIMITGTSVSPASGTPQDFTQPVPYTVSAQNGTMQVYTVTVTVAP